MSASTPLSLDDYDAIATAVMETERGRWFLAEFARRNRAADTAAVLEALAAVEARLTERRPASPSGASETAEAVGHLNAAGDVAARIHEALSADPKPRRYAARALLECAELESRVARALDALGAPARPARPLRLAAPPEVAETDPEPEDRSAPIETGADEVGEAPAAIVAQTTAPCAKDAASAGRDPIPKAALVMNGEAIDLTEGLIAPAVPPVRPEAPRSAAARPVMPKAWTPGLLEGLSDEEKAILFA